MSNTQLLASSPTLEGITKMLNRFYYSTRWTVDPETLAIKHPEKDVTGRLRVVLKRGRYRLEKIT